jgi:hypothetical protein
MNLFISSFDMKKFILHSATFVIIYFIINSLCFYFIAYPLLYKDYFQLVDETQFSSILLSDSHGKALGKNAIEKYQISNLSYGSDSYWDMYHKLVYLNRIGQVDTVILTLDNHNLSPYRENLNNLSRSIALVEFKELDSSLELSYFDFFRESVLGFWLPLTNTANSELFQKYFIKEFKKYSKKNEPLADNKPKKKTKRKTWADLREEQRIGRTKYRTDDQFPEGAKRSEVLTKSLLNIIEYCEANSMTLIGLKFPITQHLIDGMDGQNFNSDSIFYAKNLRIIDFQSLYRDRNKLFGDQDHLNKQGSLLFCDTLVKAIRTVN